MTAMGLLTSLAVPKGQWLLQSAAGGAIGRQIICIAKHKGLQTINLVRRKEQVQELLDLGYVILAHACHLGLTLHSSYHRALQHEWPRCCCCLSSALLGVVLERPAAHDKLKLVLCRGDAVICTEDTDVKAEVTRLTDGEGASGAADCVGGSLTGDLNVRQHVCGYGLHLN